MKVNNIKYIILNSKKIMNLSILSRGNVSIYTWESFTEKIL
jgi:hypothetical protein